MPKNKLRDWFTIFHKALCVCSKQSIPEVEAVITLLTPQLEGFWRGIADEAAQLVEAELLQLNVVAGGDRQQRESRFIEDVLIVLLSLVRERTRRDLPRALSRAIDRAMGRLAADGANSTRLGQLTPAQVESLRQEAKADLLNMLRGRLPEHEGEVRRAIRTWVSSPVLSGLRGRLDDVPASGLPRALAQWREALEDALGAGVRRWIGPVVDLWAYRWWNLGIFAAGEAAGVLAWEAYAVLDNRTTPFCRTFIGRGRIVAIDKLRGQFQALRNAARAEDATAAIQAWPLLDATQVASAAAWEGFWNRPTVGFPPYHWRCRTRIRPVRL